MVPCLFCSIVAGSSPAAVVAQTPEVVAFLDTAPVFFGHTLVVPRQHLVTLEDLPEGLHAPFLAAVSRVAGAVRRGTGAQGTLVLMNNVVSQSVAHLHAHVVPRTKGDGLRGFMWPRHRYPDEATREAIRAAIAGEFESES
ncbi:MAG TPA: HIT family protein [Acidimicrobiia bacterium]|nr:HIT family protein [Acidimicrobiia bacterium]